MRRQLTSIKTLNKKIGSNLIVIFLAFVVIIVSTSIFMMRDWKSEAYFQLIMTKMDKVLPQRVQNRCKD